MALDDNMLNKRHVVVGWVMHYSLLSINHELYTFENERQTYIGLIAHHFLISIGHELLTFE